MKLLWIVLIVVFLSLGAAAQTQDPNCRTNRKVPYPVTQVQAEQKIRIALLNLCPPNQGMAARPMIPTMKGDKSAMQEYDIVQVFKNKRSAEKYTEKHNITNISF